MNETATQLGNKRGGRPSRLGAATDTEFNQISTESRPKGTPIRFWILVTVNLICLVGLLTSTSYLMAGLMAIATKVRPLLIAVSVGFSRSIASVFGLLHVR